MNLETALHELETWFETEAYLLAYAEKDTIGGYHSDPALRTWPPGGIWEVEGKVLYALVRALKPRNCVEIGIGLGCSASHIAAALKAQRDGTVAGGLKNWPYGHLTSIDRGNSGPLIPDDLRPFITILPGDGADWLAEQPDNSIDFLFEDADHSEEFSYRIGTLVKRKLKRGGILIAHDASHASVGQDIQAGYRRAGLDYRVFNIEPADTGLLIWRRTE